MPGVILEDDVVRLGALKMSEDGRALVVRLFEPTGASRDTRVRIPALGLDFPVTLGPFELQTLLVDLATRTVTRADLLERAEVAR
jgi:alpha-mannosidase